MNTYEPQHTTSDQLSDSMTNLAIRAGFAGPLARIFGVIFERRAELDTDSQQAQERAKKSVTTFLREHPNSTGGEREPILREAARTLHHELDQAGDSAFAKDISEALDRLQNVDEPEPDQMPIVESPKLGDAALRDGRGRPRGLWR